MTPEQTEARRLRLEAAHAPRLRAVLDAEGAALAAAVAAGRDPAGALDVEGLTDALAALWADAVTEFAHRTAADLMPTGKAVKRGHAEFDFAAVVRRFVRLTGATLVAGITGTTLDLVRAVVAEGEAEGWNPRRTAREMRKRWAEVSRVRSERIARTEGVRASTHGALAGAELVAAETGLQIEKEWVATFDGRTRDSHGAMHGARAPLDGLFSVGGHPATGPGDVALPASESINCRCAVAFVVAEPKALGPLDRRNAAIRSAYPALRREVGAEAAFDRLGEDHALSHHTVREIVYRRGAYA